MGTNVEFNPVDNESKIRIDVNILRKILNEILDSILHNLDGSSVVTVKVNNLRSKIGLIIEEITRSPKVDESIKIKIAVDKHENRSKVIISCDRYNRDGLAMFRNRIKNILDKLLKFRKDIEELLENIDNIDKNNTLEPLDEVVNRLSEALRKIEDRQSIPLINPEERKKVVIVNI